MNDDEKEDGIYLLHILEEIEAMLRYTKDGEQDDKTQRAVIRCFEVMGEASKRVSASLKEDYPDIPWGEMVSMRNVLIHNYLGISEKTLWQTVKHDIPPLYEQLRRVYDTIEGSKKGEKR